MGSRLRGISQRIVQPEMSGQGDIPNTLFHTEAAALADRSMADLPETRHRFNDTIIADIPEVAILDEDA